MLSSRFHKLCRLNYSSQDILAILLLLVFYIFQGIIIGISLSIPPLLQSNYRVGGYNLQATLSISAWPFALKLLWAPLVDSLYIKFIGRRKTWLIIIQYAIGIELLVLSGCINDWFGRDPNKTWSQLGSHHPVNIIRLTIAFFILIFLTATQDIVVDGWALTMLSKKNVGWSSTCNKVGQSLGSAMAFIPLVCLESPEIPNKYFRRTPIEDKGFVTYPGFLYVSGLAFMILNTLVVVFKHEKGSKLDETIRHFVKRLFCKSKHTKQSLNTEHTNEKSVNSLDQFYAKTDNDITYLKSSSLDCVLAGDTESTEVSAKSQPNQDEVEESENLSLLDTYKIIIGVIQLKPVALYLIIIILVKVCSFGVYFAINLKLIEQGFAKEKLALMTLAFVPVEFILPLLFVRYTVGPKPLTFGIMTFIPRLLSNCLFIPIIHFTPYFRMLNDNSMINHSNLTTLIDNTTTIHNNTLDMMINKPTYSFPWIFYGILTGGFLCEKITSVIIYVQFQAFNAKISDPVIGGTYMTLLNTVSNIANTLGSTICLALIEPLTIRSCSKNETHSGIGKNTAETLGNSSLSLDENKTTESCVKLFDGYFIEVIAFLIIGLISFIWFIYPKVKYLEKLPTTKFTYNPTTGERTCFTRVFDVCRKTEKQSLVLTNNIECIHDKNNDDRNDNHNKNTIYRDENNSSQTNHL